MKRTRRFSRDAASVTAARRFVGEVLAGLAAEELEPVALMVSELATNAVRHTHTAFEVSIEHDRAGAIRVEVSDRSTRTPVMRSPTPSEPTGRGLRIVDMLSSEWGVEHIAGDGKTVWFTVAARIAA